MSESLIIRIIRIVLLLVILAGIVWFVIWIFSPKRPSTSNETPPSSEVVEQPNYTNVQYVQEGEVTAPEDHYSIVITINNTSRTIAIYNAYQPVAITTQSFANSQVSYDSLYAALVSSGFFAKKDNKDNYDRAGYCPLGIKYDYKAGNDINFPDFSSWSASCSIKAGTFNGNKSDVKKLFTNQIPDYKTITEDVTL